MRTPDLFSFTREGVAFRCDVSRDLDSGYPWDTDDGIGVVVAVNPALKRPRWIHLLDGSRSNLVYDRRATIAKAKREGWGVDTTDYPNLSKQQTVFQSVDIDCEYCKDWLQELRYYVVLRVSTDLFPGQDEYLGGVEASFYPNDGTDAYIKSCANDLADEILRNNNHEPHLEQQ